MQSGNPELAKPKLGHYKPETDKNQNVIFTPEVRDRLFKISNPDEKFEAIRDVIKANPRPYFELRKFDMEIIVGLLYPKLDFHVSATTNHLLKAPFNLHQANQALSIPLINVKEFDIKNHLDLNDLVTGQNPLQRPKGRLNHCFNDYVRKMEQFCQELEQAKRKEEAELTEELREHYMRDFDIN